MVFAQPDNLFFLALLVPLVAAWIAYGLWYERVRKRVGDAELITAMTSTVDHRGLLLSRAFQLLGLVLIIVALAQPQWGMSDEEVEQEAIDIVFALDMSRSMLAEDVAPNRLVAANQELRDIMNRLGGDRVALVIFTSISYVQSPLTTDYAAIDFYLRRLHPDQIPVGGTSLGAAMQDSIEALRGRNIGNGQSSQMQRAKNQVVVLITDGEDHESSPTAAAEQARDLGIRVVTVGVGSRDGSPIPEYDERGNRTGYVRNANGETVVTRLDEDTLRAMAQITGGTYIHFDRPGQVTSQLIAYLDELERTAFETRVTERYIDRFMLFLVPGFLLLLISLFLGRRRGSVRALARRILPLSLLLGALGLFSGCDAAMQGVEPRSDRAARAIEEGDFEEALRLLDEIEADFADLPEYHFNRGRALLGLERFSDAREAFARALSSDDDHLRADAFYHMGLALAGEQDWAEAYVAFSRGLKIFNANPAIQDTELRRALQHNLEVALRELYPPCSTFEDRFEPNSVPAQAAHLEELELAELTLCGGNDDFFVLPVSLGSILSVTATFSQLRDHPDPEQAFLSRPQGVQLAIYEPGGKEILIIDQGAADSEDDLATQNRRHRVERKIADFELGADHLGGVTEAPLFIALRADPGLEFSYELNVDIIEPCAMQDDHFEPNPSADQAAPMDPGAHELHICPTDEDWFTLSVDRGDSLFVDIKPQPDRERELPPELKVELYRADTRQLLGRGYFDGTALTAGIQDIDFDSDILVRVFGVDDDQQGPYSLEAHHLEPCEEAGEEPPRPRGLAIPEEARELRYLRRCNTADDYFQVTPGEDGELEWMLQAVPEQAWQGRNVDLSSEAPFGAFPELEFVLLAQDQRTVLQHAELLETDAPALTQTQVLVAEEEITTEHALMRLSGAPGFFHLRRLDGEDQDQDDQDEQDQDDDQDQDQDQDEQDQDEQDQDQDEGQDEQDQEEEDQPADEQEQEEEQAAPEQAERQEEEDLNPEHREILRSLEEADDNFQLQRRLRNVPRRPVERNW